MTLLLFNLDILATIVKKNYNFNKISKYFDSFMMKIPKVKARKTFNRKKLFLRIDIKSELIIYNNDLIFFQIFLGRFFLASYING